MTLEEAQHRFPPIWTIYESPSDYPGKIVVRCWYGEVPCPEVKLFHGTDEEGIEDARRYALDEGASLPLERQLADDPSILECWI